MPNHKIMIVEDEKIVAMDIQSSLEKMGYSVCATASSGMEAIKKADLTRPDLILMDIVLKGSMDGIEAAKQIKELNKIPVVYLTAFGEDGMLQKAKITEPYGYIIKPFKERDLQIAIEISIYKKQAEGRIQRMERWLATVLKSIGDAVIASDKDRRITFMNAVAEKLTGWNQEDALGKKLTEVLKIKDQDLSDLEKHLVEKVITEGLIINLIEDRMLIAKDGKEVPISDSAAPIKDDNGETPGSVLVFRDITETKQAEKNLRSHQIELEMQNEELRRTHRELEVSQAKYFDLYDLAPVGYLTINEKGLIIEANLTVVQLLSLKKSDLVNQPLTRFILPVDQDIFYRSRKLLFETQVPQVCEMRMVKKDHASFWVRMEAAMTKDTDGSPICRAAMIDITERKKAENLLKESSRRLYDIIDFLPDATLVIDREGKVIAWNRAIEAMTGVKSEEMLGKGDYEYALPFYGERRPILIDLALRPEPEREKQYTTIQRNGDILFGEAYTPKLAPGNIHLSATASVLRNAQGDITAAIECIRNNTDRKNMEDRLQRVEKMESLGLLAGGVAHDLNNTLGILVGYSELLYDGLDESDPLREDARNIMLGGEQAAAIIQDLLTLARRGAQTKTVINLNKTVTEYIKSPEFRKLTFLHPDVRVKTELEEELIKIAGSHAHLSKTLMNLVLNAVEAMTSGGEVIIRTENRYLDRPISGYDELLEGDYVVLTVSDEGEGITDDDMKRIFEPFYTKKVMGRSGTGLGLSVVWGTVKDHNGYIDVKSRRGKGTTFTLYFPVTREEVEEDKITPMSEYMGRGEKILVVDDIDVQRDLASRILKKLDYRVEFVSSGEEAVVYLKENTVDLVILDMIMDPGIDGFETYRQISEIRPKQKAIIVSGFAETERVKMAQSLGAGAFIKKPYIRERIGLAVRKELDRK